MKPKLYKEIFFFFFIAIIVSQSTDQAKTQQIQLNQLYNISLMKDEARVFKVTIKNLKKDESLFVETASPTYDPYEIPTVVIRSQPEFEQLCTQENNEYLGICEIEYEKLKEDQVFDIEIKCRQNCNLRLETFLSDTLELTFGEKVQINALETIGTVQQLKIQVPQNLNFTDISLIATFSNDDQIKTGIQIYVNIGPENTSIPTAQNYDFKGRQVWGSGVGVFLSNKNIKAGQWIKILLVIGDGVKIEFYSRAVNGNKYGMLLNTAYKDFTSENQTKTYILELNNLLGQTNDSFNLDQKTIEIIFVVYSGVPDIKVGFEPTLKTYLDNYDIQGTFSYLVTPEIRKKNNFTGSIYIQVSSYWTSNYYLFSFAASDKYSKLSDGVSQLNRAEPGQVQNYIYESFVVLDNKTDPINSYRLRIQIMQGNGDVGIRRCLSFQNDSSLDCLITNITQLDDPATKKTFDQLNITLKKQWDSYELLFDYNVSLCSVYKKYEDLVIYICDFQVIVFPARTSEKALVYSVTMMQNREQSDLKQGYAYKDFLYADTYHYYQFELPSLENVEQVTFFMTVISGDAGIMGTTNKALKYMDWSEGISSSDVIISLFNTLTFKKEKLANAFYIAVYAYEASDLTVSVIVKRSDANKQNTNDTTTNTTSNKTEVTTLSLIQGLSQQYTLNQGSGQIKFAFTSQKAGNLSVQIIQVTGSVSYSIQKQAAKEQINCLNSAQAGELRCTFEAQSYADYVVTVKGTEADLQTFSISYFYQQTCKKYMFNLPQFVFLTAQQSQCSTFTILDQSKSLRILTSFSTLDLLATNITFIITFNEKFNVTFSGRQKLITSDELKEFCKSNKTMANCNMQVLYKGDQSLNIRFYFVVEQEGTEMALFDGIVRKVVDTKMTQKKGKFFYYEVTSNKDSIKIFTTNRDNVGYYIGAKFVDIIQFTASPDTLYLPYREANAAPEPNAFETRLNPAKGTSVIQINAEEFTKNCKACVMLVSVYGLSTQSNQANIFEVQVTQTESFIYLGEQQTGFLSEDQIYIYNVYANPEAESLLVLRDFMKESEREKDCYTATLFNQATKSTVQIKNGYHIIQKSAATFKVFIENTKQSVCTYQISYSALNKPVTQVNPSMPLQIKLTKSEAKYLLYYHLDDDYFQILNYIKSGDVKIYANKVGGNMSIENLVSKNLDLFDFKSVPGDSFLEIQSTNSKFCKNCYYLIAIKGDPSVQAEMAIAKGNQALGLTTYGILKQTLKRGQEETYAYYSIFDFNISIPLLFGELHVTILTPENKTFYNQSISMSTQIVIPKPTTAQGQYVDFYDSNSRFEIRVEAVKDSSYYISTKRKNVSLRVYQGLPVVLEIGNQLKTVEFVNVNEGEHVSVLLEIKEDIDENFKLMVSAEVMKDGEVSSSKIEDPIVKQSEKSMNYLFKSIKGTYFITIGANKYVTASMILVKKKLTHLMSSNSNLFTEKGTFEIYTPGHNLMIVVDTCLNDVEVKASEKYDALSNESSNTATVLLEHANYGGHYIITAENVQGEYFVEVEPKNSKDSMLYIISYYYYDRSDDMPYRKVDIDPDISYELASDKIIFILNPVRLLPSKQKFKIIPTYTLYISNSSNTTTMNSKCDLNVGFSQSQTASSDNEDVIKFPIDYKTLAQQVGENSDVYFVSAKVKIRFEGENLVAGYPPYVDLAYVKLQLTQSTHKIEFKSQTTSNIKYIILWVVIPILISLILFVLALKFCIKKYRMMYPDQLVEEDRQMGPTTDQIHYNQKSEKGVDSLTNT